MIGAYLNIDKAYRSHKPRNFGVFAILAPNPVCTEPFSRSRNLTVAQNLAHRICAMEGMNSENTNFRGPAIEDFNRHIVTPCVTLFRKFSLRFSHTATFFFQ